MYDDDYHLFESRAIVRYACAKYGMQSTITKLVPLANDARALGKFELACSIKYSQFSPIVDHILKEVIFPRKFQKPVDEKVEAMLKAGLKAKLDVYNNILKDQKYLAGEDVTLADLFHLPECSLLSDELDPDLITSRENLARWYKDISARSSWSGVKDGIKGTAA